MKWKITDKKIYLYILLCVGICLLLFTNNSSSTSKKSPDSSDIESRLATAIESLGGVSDVSVMVCQGESSGDDYSYGSTATAVVTKGVVVVGKGVTTAKNQLEISEMMSTLCQVGLHQVKIFEKTQ